MLWWWLVSACSSVVPADTTDPLGGLRERPLSYTHHARCRMACRDVSELEVEQVLRQGSWVPERTRLDGECPSHAVEGHSDDGQHLRIVYAACAETTRVVTAIDLDVEHHCDCD